MLIKFLSPIFIPLLGIAITQTFGCTTYKDSSAIAQTSPQPAPQEIVQPGEVLALPGKLVDNPQTTNLTIPQRGKAISYTLDTLRNGRLGTQQIQTAKMLVRYPDTAYEAHGNYGVEYKLTLPLSNNTSQNQTVTVTLETPLKEDKLSQGGVRFRKPSLDFPFFRGTVRLRYFDDQGQQKTRYVHLWHRTGQVLEPLVQVVLPPSTKRIVQVDVIYPPDSTPPQVLSVRTLEK